MTKTHYRVLRSSVVLARQSAAFLRDATPDLVQAVAEVKAKNYQFDQIDSRTLEVLFAGFDDAFTQRVRDEYTFFPRLDSVRIHAAAVAVCELCGKGDSKETGDNRDHLKIEYCLTNTAGGKDTWCGATCIKNYGLKVDGAATAEEAARLLDQAMRQAVRQYMINEWRNEYPDHEMIPEHYQQARGFRHRIWQLEQHIGEVVLMGGEDALGFDWRMVNSFKNAAAFYLREGYLTPKKLTPWLKAKAAIAKIDDLSTKLTDAAHITDPDARIDHFLKLVEKNNEAAA